MLVITRRLTRKRKRVGWPRRSSSIDAKRLAYYGLSWGGALGAILPAIEPRADRMRAALAEGFATATDLADYLVRKGMPFRDAHEVVARAVREAESAGKDLADLPLERLRAFSALIGPDVREALTPEGSVAARSHVGGTAPAAVLAAIRRARRTL